MTSLGSREHWAPHLEVLIDLMMDSRQPMFVAAGPELLMIYNDAYGTMLSDKHPQAFGAPFRRVFADIIGQLEPSLQRVLAGAQEIMVDQHCTLPWRENMPEGWFTATWTPTRDEQGEVAGFVGIITETTDQHLMMVRLRANEDSQSFLLKLTDALRPPGDAAETSAEIQQVEDVAEGTWAPVERTRIETALRNSEARYRSLFETMGQGYIENELIRDANGRAVDYRTKMVNPQFERLTGVPADEAVGRTARELVKELDPAWLETYERVVRTGEPEQFEREEPAFGRWFNVQAYHLAGDRFAILYDDITDRKRAEAALRDNQAALAIELANTSLLRDLAIRSVTEGSEQALYDEILSAAISITQSQAGTVQVYEPETRSLALLVTRNFRSNMTEHFHRVDAASNTACGIALRTGQRTIIDFDDETDLACVMHVEAGYRSAQATPLLSRTGAPIGMLNTHWSEPQHRPTEQQLRYLDLLARQAADMIEQRDAQKALRESEERQAFLLKLTDVLRPMADPIAVQEAAAALLGRYLGASRTFYLEVELEAGVEYVVATRDFHQEDVPSVVGRYPRNSFGDYVGEAMRAGRTLSIADSEAHPGLTEAERGAYRSMVVRSFAVVSLIKDGKNVAGMVLHQVGARAWTPFEIGLLEETAERTWAAVERARAEAALRESEARFQQFADASAGALWIRDAATLKMEYVSPAISIIYGVEPETFLNGVEVWASSIVPEDRETALRHIEQAREGKAVVHEFRIQRANDLAFRWIRNTDFPLYDGRGLVERIGGIAEDVTEVRLAVEHQGVLLHELQHRVRNIMGIIRSIGNRSAGGAASVEDYRTTLEGRMLALARVQAVLTREANAGGSLRDIIKSEVAVQAHHQQQCELIGPDIMLSPKSVEVLTLAFHELSTNALKYGAFSIAEGRLVVRWAPFEKRGNQWLGIDWVEEGVPPGAPSGRRGYGSELIEARIPYELGGTGKIGFESDGAQCRIEFPLTYTESILETDSPMPTTMFGGTTDMTGAPDLTGRTILVVEDDYYLASDTAAALRGAGAKVLGPCPSEDAAMGMLNETAPSHAVLDLNLGGGGPEFRLARVLKQKGIPFIFLTGYDPEVIPLELTGVTRLQKPVPFKAIVEAVSQL
ncbi:MAG: PAS domain S-box protein [Candidatus Devosia phytovorans]|uniref:Blue-light-activated histidine kinase n=1 Tax=Candidatus Devosia phytovorans TaxID=3121372 RepID=A0AAJ6AYH9_9HYPH|nr:GAF domain-containing protein [Devosia sp.]WEK02947.1 MAG: PAS domain S-box protein [Devosia sp.]